MKELQEEYRKTTQEYERAQKKWEKTRNLEDWSKAKELMDTRLVLYSRIAEVVKSEGEKGT